MSNQTHGSNGTPHTPPENTDRLTTRPLPASRKVFIKGQQGVRVPMREISLNPTKISGSDTGEANQPVRVYDTSGPYTDPDIQIDIRKGLFPLRSEWIINRGDVQTL
ncbi:MAG: phosphomethylpyrimidine synthase ThiC, partial [Nitrospiria bacterium]